MLAFLNAIYVELLDKDEKKEKPKEKDEKFPFLTEEKKQEARKIASLVNTFRSIGSDTEVEQASEYILGRILYSAMPARKDERLQEFEDEMIEKYGM